MVKTPLYSLLLALSGFASPPMLASAAEAVGADSEFLEAERSAIEYASRTGNVGILIGYKEFPGSPGVDAIGEKLVKRFEEHGQAARYFVFGMDRPGVGVVYHIRDISIEGETLPFGAYGLRDAVSNIERVASANRGGQTLENEF